MDPQDGAPTRSRYRPASHPAAVHLLAGAPSWDLRSAPGIACGTAVPVDKPERWTRKLDDVTCDECRMSDAFRSARAAKRPRELTIAEKVAAACRWLGVKSEDEHA